MNDELIHNPPGARDDERSWQLTRRGALGGMLGVGLAGVLGGRGLAATRSTTPATTSGIGTSGTGTSGTGTSGTGASGSSAGGVASLAFPADAFTEQTTTVTTAAGSKAVTYRSWSALPYVMNPVDVGYQSLNVAVPVGIDGAAVDASSAPILFNITVGGYLSAAASGAATGGGTPPGGQGGSPPSGSMPAGGGTGGPPAGGSMPAGGPPSGGSTPPAGGGSGGAGGGFAGQGGARTDQLALAAGYVVVTPGCRGRDNQAADGTYFGKAPACIVDLTAALRYVHFNKGVLPGDTARIVSCGTSAGGALSALLGASAGSNAFDEQLTLLGAAEADETLVAVGAWCPITDLDHADMAYEFVFGKVGSVDQTVSGELSSAFAGYLAGLGLTDGAGSALTVDTYPEFLLATYLQPAAATYLAALSDTDRTTYLSANSWLAYDGTTATFTLADFAAHCGRSKSIPAFDGFDLSRAENILFGNESTNARHFTEYSLRHESGDPTATLDDDLPATIDMMNPMHFLAGPNASRATHWWLRVGTSDSDTSPTVIANLATRAANLGDDVNLLMYWDAGHGANQDPDDFIAWIGKLT